MGVGSDFLREQFVFILDVVRKRWLLFCVPVMLASLLAIVVVKMAPTKYTASSLILLQAANRNVGGSGSLPYSNTLEQVQAIGAWLKSDHVLAEILPQMSDYKEPETPAERFIKTRILAASLSLDLVGNSVLEVKLEGRRPEGLGRDLEIILSRLMEGLTGPEQNVFSAPQFVQMRRNEDVANAETALAQAIEDGGFQDPAQVRTDLHRLWTLTQQSRPGGRIGTTAAQPTSLSEAETIEEARRAISSDAKEVDQLAHIYAAYQEARARQGALQVNAGPVRSNYVSIFSSPEDLLIIGRPKDPIIGENSGRKLAVGGILLSVVGGLGLVLLAELFDSRLRTRSEYETASGLPVVARLARVR